MTDFNHLGTMLEALEDFHTIFGHPVSNTIDLTEKETNVDLRVRLSEEEMEEFKEAVVLRDKEGVLDALADRFYLLLGDVVSYGYQDYFIKAFWEVHNSNLSKLGEDGKPIFREDGKILKGPKFFEPDLKKIINE